MRSCWRSHPNGRACNIRARACHHRTVPGRKGLFLDRDGVINLERGYVSSRDEFHFQEGIFELCRVAQSLGYLLLVVTNQAGIARGYYTESDFLTLTEWMVERFAEQQIRIARVYYCPFHPEGIGEYRRDSEDRKPRPGMLLRARDEFELDLGASLLIGDRPSDIDAAESAGVGTRILLETESTEGYVPEGRYYRWRSLAGIQRRFFPPASEAESPRLLVDRNP